MKRIFTFGLFLLMYYCAHSQMSQFQTLYIYNFATKIGWAVENATKGTVRNIIYNNSITTKIYKLGTSKTIIPHQSTISTNNYYILG